MNIVIPSETTFCIVSLPRWQREWFKKHKTINRSGYFQKCTSMLIAEKDPEYFAKFQELAEHEIRRNDTTPQPEKIMEVKN